MINVVNVLCYGAECSICANQQALDWLENGVRLPVNECPPSFEIANRQFSSKPYKFISAEIRELVATVVIRQVNYGPTCVSPVSWYQRNQS